MFESALDLIHIADSQLHLELVSGRFAFILKHHHHVRHTVLLLTSPPRGFLKIKVTDLADLAVIIPRFGLT